MSPEIKRILLITRKVQFAIDIKRSLEALGEYQVTPVSEARNAIEQLRRAPHHLVLLDTVELGMGPAILIDLIRARQSEIAIVLAPDDEVARELARQFDVDAVVDLPASARSLVPVMEQAMRQLYDALPQTLRLPAVDLRDDTVQIETLVDEALGEQANPSYTLQRLQASYRLLQGTDQAETEAALNRVELVIESDADGETIHFRKTDDGSAPLDSTDEAPQADLDTPISDVEAESTVGDLAAALTTTEEIAVLSQSESSENESLDDSSLRETLESALNADASAPVHSRTQDRRLEQAAAAMTQLMTELTAEATLLTRGNAPVAFAGDLSLETLARLRRAIGDDWEAGPGQARMRFLTLPADGSQYMLWSKVTADGLTLSLIFAGGQSLTAIGQQAERMLSALAHLPETEAEPAIEAESPPPPDTRALAFVWLTAEGAPSLSETVARHIVFWLETELNARRWTIQRLDVYDDFVLLRADAPVGETPDALARELMTRSRDIARMADAELPEALWADAYLVVQPGRDLTTREVRGFLAFARDEAKSG